MIVRYFVQDPLYDVKSGDDYLLVFQVPEHSRNERAFVHMLETLGLDYIKEDPKPREQWRQRESTVVEGQPRAMGRATVLDSSPKSG